MGYHFTVFPGAGPGHYEQVEMVPIHADESKEDSGSNAYHGESPERKHCTQIIDS